MKKYLAVITAIIFIIILFHPGRHAKYYNYVQVANVVSELVPISVQDNLKNCSLGFYKQLLESEEEQTPTIFTTNIVTQVVAGGIHIPNNCIPIFKTAIIVPYRNRPEQLEAFLNYIHPFLQSQKIHYQIFIVDQKDHKAFNRAKMLNIGAKVASEMHFPCLILHDVDLFPLSNRNIYACSKNPRHMSSAVNTLRFNLPYLEIVGGVFAILTKHFHNINGMSNEFYGWGGEDDDFYRRLNFHGMEICRFPPELSEYFMLFHKKEPASNDRWAKLEHTIDRSPQDGYHSIQNNFDIEYEPLYTHIIVK